MSSKGGASTHAPVHVTGEHDKAGPPEARGTPGQGVGAAATPGGGERSPLRSHLLVIAGWLVVLLVVGAAWQFAATQEIVNPVFSGRPTEIIKEFWDGVTGTLLTVDARATVIATLIGFAGAAVLGILSAFALSQSTIARRIFEPYFTALNSLPRVALAPIFLLWFGIGMTSKIALAASLTYFVTFYNTMAGIDSVDRDHLVLARSLGATRFQVFRKFVLPSAVPSMFTGLQLGLVYGMLGTVAGEMIAGKEGLGVELTRQAALFQTNAYFGTLLLLVLVTTFLSTALELIRRRLLKWQRAHMAESQLS